ncbi:hypothetical protein ACEQPO_25660 [Bacillus sp. SL00103]
MFEIIYKFKGWVQIHPLCYKRRILIHRYTERDERADHLLESIQERFGVQPTRLMQFMKNRGELNIVYTSEYFQPSVDAVNDSFVFIGPSFLKKGRSA